MTAAADAAPELALVVPTYCERDNLAPLLDLVELALRGVRWELVVVDDDSPDGTADAARELSRRDPRVRVLHRVGRRGLSSACIEGMLASTAPCMAVMDADLQHDESILPRMLAELRGGADLVVGTRYDAGGSAGELGAGRRLISRAATRLGTLLLRVRLSDPMSGFFMLRRELLDRVVHGLSGKGFKILLDIVATAGPGLRVREVPYRMRARRHGASKLDALVVGEYVLLLADKLVGRWLPARFLLFVAAGATGVAVHLAALGVLHRVVGVSFLAAQAAATLLAMTNNFIVNNLFTYSDQRLRGAQFVRGLLSFYLACALGALVNVQLADLLFERAVPWWLAGVIGAAAGAVWNYAITASFTWGAWRRS